MSTVSAMDFCPIVDIEAVDLSRHALVEASAGTGKTYTIENLVVRLLKEEPDLTLDKILLVTFTEKATSELKIRIRQKIEQSLYDNCELTDVVRQKLSETLDAFDDAAITTIHGFCHTLLREFPFETGSLFQQEVIDDTPLLVKLLKAQMRRDWPLRYGERLEVLLGLANFAERPDQFIDTVVTLTQQLSGDPTHEILIPDPAEMDVDNLWQSALQTVTALKALVGDPPLLSEGYGRLNINKRTRSVIIRDMVEPVQRALERVEDPAWRLTEFMPVVAVLGAKHTSGTRNLDRLVPQKWLKAGENLHECPNLEAIRDHLAVLIRLFSRLAHVLTLSAVSSLRHAARTMKARHGWISYQDMLTLVADFLTGEGAAEGVGRIRKRYRVAFVDEFQDTDAVQWRIFSTLFLDAGNGAPENRLFLIGDPKQAIYAFRGADVFTYLDARQRMKRLAARGLVNLYELTQNWRSTPDLVRAFNRIFAQDDWFGSRDGQGRYAIGYTPSTSPPLNRLPSSVNCDQSQHPPLNVIDLTAAGGHAAAKSMLAGFICREIHALVENGGIRITTGSGRQRPLHFGDIAILVRSQSEFSQIEPLFKQALIPYSYYRKPGLFQSRESHWLSLLLRAIASPQLTACVNLAMLTPFFDIDAADLVGDRELPQDHAIQRLLTRWHSRAQKRHWGPLFQSLMEDSGLTFRRCMEPGWERSATNFQQLFDFLETSAYIQNLDMEGVVTLLDSLCLGTSGVGSEADIHQIEGEGDKVQVLTMHVSKGLEFPVVFIAGGLTVRSDDGMRVYHRVDPANPDQGCRKVIDLTKTTGRIESQEEALDEDKRLYYVALTRSKFKLYVPYYPASGNHRWIGPVSRFVSASIQQAFFNANVGSPMYARHEIDVNPVLTAGLPRGRNDSHQERIRLPSGDLLPLQTDFRQRKISLESFSSIGHRIGHMSGDTGPSTAFSLTEVVGREVDEPVDNVSSPFLDPESSDTLPGGTRMGSMFHHIFENIDFRDVADGPADILTDASVQAVITSAMTLYRIEPHLAPQVARMVAATLRTPIDIDGASLVLGRLSPVQRRHELEFYFPFDDALATGATVPGCTVSVAHCGEMVMRGFIDLVFTWQDRYYIADWKSNRLPQGYHQAAMAGEIAAARYDLQYRLYTIATLRWLGQRLGSRFDPRHHFGGAIYIFIRGMSSGNQKGIFHVAPDKLLPLESLEADMRQQIAGLQW